ncbi:hypothetical protein [uncultured Nostoc sp.]
MSIDKISFITALHSSGMILEIGVRNRYRYSSVYHGDARYYG